MGQAHDPLKDKAMSSCETAHGPRLAVSQSENAPPPSAAEGHVVFFPEHAPYIARLGSGCQGHFGWISTIYLGQDSESAKAPGG